MPEKGPRVRFPVQYVLVVLAVYAGKRDRERSYDNDTEWSPTPQSLAEEEGGVPTIEAVKNLGRTRRLP